MERDYSKLKGKIVEVFQTQYAFAKKMGLSEKTISLKMNGKIDFTQSDIAKAARLLGLQDNQIPEYFFTNKVQ